MENWIFFPPVAFLLLLVVSIFISTLLRKLAFKAKKHAGDESQKAYACGEEIGEHRVQVDYGQFFPFAFFFTILHVVALMVATVPIENINSFFIAVVYIIGAAVGLVILFRR